MINKLYVFALVLLAGCSKASEFTSTLDTDNYRDLIGNTHSELKAIFGDGRIKDSELPQHEPGSTIQAVQINLEDKIFFAIGDNQVDKLLFRDRQFKTNRGAYIGQGYCDIATLYSEASFHFGFEDGGVLQLKAGDEKLTFVFDTAHLPLGSYVVEGEPSKNDKSLCSSHLIEIELR